MNFRYIPRSTENWAHRAAQKFDGGVFPAAAQKFALGLRGVPVTAVPLADTEPATEPEQECSDAIVGKKPKGMKALCVCGCPRNQHCTEPPMQHWPASEGAFGFYFCIFEHCEGFHHKEGKLYPCDCWAFRSTESEMPRMKMWKADEFTPCDDPACRHPKAHHCTASRKPAIRGTYQGFSLEGEPHGCKHWPGDAGTPYVCSTASCAEIGCPCLRFRNPLVRKRAAKPRQTAEASDKQIRTLIPRQDLLAAKRRYLAEQAEPKTKTKAEILIEVVHDYPDATVAVLAEAAERSPSWVRRTLKAAGVTLAKPVRQKRLPVTTDNAIQLTGETK